MQFRQRIYRKYNFHFFCEFIWSTIELSKNKTQKTRYSVLFPRNPSRVSIYVARATSMPSSSSYIHPPNPIKRKFSLGSALRFSLERKAPAQESLINKDTSSIQSGSVGKKSEHNPPECESKVEHGGCVPATLGRYFSCFAWARDVPEFLSLYIVWYNKILLLLK